MAVRNTHFYQILQAIHFHAKTQLEDQRTGGAALRAESELDPH